MSQARDQLVEVLHERRHEIFLTDEAFADRLMPIVREAIARGLENAADELDELERHDVKAATPQAWLRQWAQQARVGS